VWIIIYSCSFNRVKARHSALCYKKSSRRSSGSHPRRRRSARCPAFGSLQKRPSTPLACWLVAAAQHLAPRGWAPAVPIATSAATAGRPCVPPPTPGLLRAASRPHEDRDPTRQQLDVRAGGRRWSPRGKGCPGRVGAPWAGPLLLSAGAGHRGSGRLNHSGRRWVGGVPGPQQLCPGSGVEGAGPGVLATGPSWGPPEAEGLTLVGRRDLPLDRRSHHCCHLGSRDSRSLSQVGETFCSGDCRNVCQPHSRCLLCLWREPWGAGSRLVGGTLGQPWGEMLPGGRFLSPLPRDCEHVPSDRTPLAVPGKSFLAAFEVPASGSEYSAQDKQRKKGKPSGC